MFQAEKNKSNQSPTKKAASNTSKSKYTTSESSKRGIPAPVIQKMEKGLNADFSDVQVKTNSQAASTLGAHAFTRGNEVHFAPGKFDPASTKGQELIGHELAHVVQQRQGRVAPTVQAKGLAVNDSEHLEHEADVMGRRAAQQPFSPATATEALPVQMKANAVVQMWNPFKRKKKYDSKSETSWTENKGGTASDVYKARYNKTIGKSGRSLGFAKFGMKKGDKENDTTINLGLNANEQGELTEDPRLLARAVASSRLDQHLGTNVLADEQFGKHGKKQIGLSAAVNGRAVVENMTDKEGKLIGQKHNQINFKDSKIQKGMADLQSLDYITGQLDRHGGNIFVDSLSGAVKGIDNDMAFSKHAKSATANSIVDLPTQIDAETAEKILALDPDQLQKILNSKKGGKEKLNKEEIEATKTRLAKMKEHILKLKEEGKLVNEWNDDTYNEAVSADAGKTNKKFSKFNSYLGRSVEMYNESANDTTGFKVQETAEMRRNRPSEPGMDKVEKRDLAKKQLKAYKKLNKEEKKKAKLSKKKKAPLKPKEIYDMFNL